MVTIRAKVRGRKKPIPFDFLPHQGIAFNYARVRDCVALFMKMRLGKTLVAIRWAMYKHARRVLVVVPRPVISEWERQIERDRWKCCRLTGTNRIQKMFRWWNDKTFFLTNPEAVIKTGVPILEQPWDAIIVDESTRIKNPTAQITKTLQRETQHIPMRAILSGMPNPEGFLDFTAQMIFLHGSFLGFKNYWSLRRALFFTDERGFDWHPKPGTIGKIKEEVRNLSLTMTRKQAGIIIGKHYRKRVIPATPLQKKLARRLEDEFSTGKVETKWVLVKLIWLARLAGGFEPLDHEGTVKQIAQGKVKELLHLLTGELHDEQAVVWFRFIEEMRAVSAALSKANVDHMHIDGSVVDEQRDHTKRLFMAGKFPVLLVQKRAGKFGLDLSCASTAIYFSYEYSNEARHQSEDRIVHPTKKGDLLYIDLVTEGSVDESVLKLLREKKAMSKHVFIQRLCHERFGLRT